MKYYAANKNYGYIAVGEICSKILSEIIQCVRSKYKMITVILRHANNETLKEEGQKCESSLLRSKTDFFPLFKLLLCCLTKII